MFSLSCCVLLSFSCFEPNQQCLEDLLWVFLMEIACLLLFECSCFLSVRWMYWTDWEEDPTESNRGKIKKAWMDGSHHTVFLTSKTVLWPNGLSLDIPNGILYWVDAYYDRIEMVYLNSTERKVGYALIIYSRCNTWQRTHLGVFLIENRSTQTQWEMKHDTHSACKCWHDVCQHLIPGVCTHLLNTMWTPLYNIYKNIPLVDRVSQVFYFTFSSMFTWKAILLLLHS